MCQISPKMQRWSWEGPAVPRLAQHCAARSRIRDAPFPTIHRMMLTRKQGRKTRTISQKKRSKKRLLLKAVVPLGEEGAYGVPHQHSFGLQEHGCSSISFHEDGWAWVVLPGLSIPVPELGRISATQGHLPKGSWCIPALGRGLWNWLHVTAPNSTHQSTEEMEQALLKSINSRKRS